MRAPERFGRYQVVRRLGGGAMGEVWLARDEALGREVAVKGVRAQPGVAEALFRARFDAEARALAALRHPAIVSVFDVGWEDDVPYLVMELVPGGSLRDRLERGPLPPDEVRALGIQIGGALAAAHAAGILHRDVKPANVLGGPGEWKLADFGIAHVPGSELTLTGQFLGTPAYAAPEALAEGEHAPAADVWGLGATLYAALTGAAPYGGAFGAATQTACAPVAERAPAAPAGLAAAIDAALARDPAARPDARALCERLAARDGAPAPASEPLASASEPSASASASGVAAAATVPGAAAPAWRWPAIAAAAVLGIGLVVALASGGSRGRGPAPGAALPAAAADDEGAGDSGAMVTVRGDGTIAVDRGQLERADRPDDLQHHLDKAVEKAERGDLDPAIHELDDLLRRDPDDEPARILRASLDHLRAQLGDEPGPPGPPGHRKHHKHDD